MWESALKVGKTYILDPTPDPDPHKNVIGSSLTHPPSFLQTHQPTD